MRSVWGEIFDQRKLCLNRRIQLSTIKCTFENLVKSEMCLNQLQKVSYTYSETSHCVTSFTLKFDKFDRGF